MKKLPRKVWSVAFTRNRKDSTPHQFTLEKGSGGKESYVERNEKERMLDWFYPDQFENNFSVSHDYVRFWSTSKNEAQAFLDGFSSVKKLLGRLFR